MLAQVSDFVASTTICKGRTLESAQVCGGLYDILRFFNVYFEREGACACVWEGQRKNPKLALRSAQESVVGLDLTTMRSHTLS